MKLLSRKVIAFAMVMLLSVGLVAGTDFGMIKSDAAPAVGAVRLDPDRLSLKVGERYQLHVIVLPQNANNKKITFRSSNTAVAEVTAGGVVIAKKKGKATIYAISSNGKKGICGVTVNEIPVKDIILNMSNVTLNKNSSATISARVVPENATNTKLTWKSSNTNVATVDAKGNIKTYKTAGTAIITVTSNNSGSNITKTCTVTVK